MIRGFPVFCVLDKLILPLLIAHRTHEMGSYSHIRRCTPALNLPVTNTVVDYSRLSKRFLSSFKFEQKVVTGYSVPDWSNGLIFLHKV